MKEQQTKFKNFIDACFSGKSFTILYMVLTALSIFLLVMIQPFGDPPDEVNRFKVVYFIANHGYLPTGYEEETILAGYGGSYAFQPILSYMIMGYLLRFMKLFTDNSYTLIVAARMVNLIMGVIMAYYVLLISRKLWKDPVMQWLFALMVTFLPMNLFMHSYVNTDSMALLSGAMILYGMLCGEEDDYSRRTCIRIGIGAVLCAMSYYNAYAIVLVAMILFFFHFARKKEWKPMFQKGGLIAAIILIGAGWWFVRNGIIYHGDFLGMKARQDCAIKTALPEYNPLTRFTFYGAGLPISAVFAEKQYAWVTFESMIAMFGPMNIPTHGLIYLYYKRLAIAAGVAALIPIMKTAPLYWEKKKDNQTRLVFGLLMVLDCLITMGLHLYYSYTWEYQPQGRYLLPMILPAAYLLVLGIWKICELLGIASERLVKKQIVKELLQLSVQGMIIMFVLLTYAYTLFVRVLPVYRIGENLTLLKQVPFGDLMGLF